MDNLKHEKPREFKCYGGPFDGKYISLTSDKTLIFRVKEYKGYYACSTAFYTGKRVDWFPLQ